MMKEHLEMYVDWGYIIESLEYKFLMVFELC